MLRRTLNAKNAKRHLSLFSRMAARIFNIAPHEAGRVFLAWILKFCMAMGYAVGWTMLTAILVNRLGISYLPLLIIANAALTMLGTLFFLSIMHRVSRQVLLFATAGSGLFVLGVAFATMLTETPHLTLFFGLALAANAFFFTQLNILLSLFAEDLFSPLEGSRAWPLIATSKYIGGIAGGLLILAGITFFQLPPPMLTVLWLGSIALVIPILAFFFARHRTLPSLAVGGEEVAHETSGLVARLATGFQHVRATPFLAGLFVVLMLQGMFYTMVNFQYTKAVDARAGYASEELERAGGPLHASAKNTNSHEYILTKDLSALYISFSAIALFFQFFFVSRIIERLGVVRTMALHPVVSIATALWLTLQFGFASAVVAKGALATTNGLFTSAYLASFYALREEVREHAKEFMEGFVTPFGVLIGTGFLIVAQFFFTGDFLTTGINLLVLAVAIAMGVMLLWMRTRYTHISKKNMDMLGDHPAKFSSIEVLAQAGHANAADILVKSLIYKKESEPMRIKILETLGRLRDPRTIPEILMCFDDPSSAVKLAAVSALGEFTDLGTHFYSQAFTRFRVISALKELFEKEDSKELRGAIVHVFANMRQAEVVPFLVHIIETASDEVRADAIYVCGLFHDVSAAHYVEPYLKHANPHVKTNALITLWQFPQYRLRLTIQLTGLLSADDASTQKAVIHLLGEIGAIQERPRLESYLEHDDEELQLLAALALAKLEHERVPEMIADFILHDDPRLASFAKKHVKRVPLEMQKKVQQIVHHRLSERLSQILAEIDVTDLTLLPTETLDELRNIYAHAGEWHEVVKIDTAKKIQLQS